MAKTRMISTDFRSDTWIDWLDPIEKLLYIYCFTNDKSSWCWATEIPLKKIWYETWIDRDMVSKILSRFETEEKVIYCSGYLIVKNFIRRHFSWIDSPDKWSKNNQLKAIEEEIGKLPNEVYNRCCGFVIWFDDICNQENKGLARGLQGACKGVVPSPLPSSSPLSSVWPDDLPKKYIIPSEQDIKNQIKQIYTEEIVNNNIPKYRLLLLFIMKWYNLKIDKKNCDKFFSDMIDKSHRYGYSWEWFADRDTLLLKAKEMYEWAEWKNRKIENHMSTLNKFLSPNPKK